MIADPLALSWFQSVLFRGISCCRAVKGSHAVEMRGFQRQWLDV